jgi:flagella basal body P-ring formation protein FlgA
MTSVVREKVKIQITPVEKEGCFCQVSADAERVIVVSSQRIETGEMLFHSRVRDHACHQVGTVIWLPT